MDTTYANQKVAVLGYGVEGKSSVRFFLSHGATVSVHDVKPSILESDQAGKDKRDGVKFVVGDQAFLDLDSYDLLVRAPSMSPRSAFFESIPSSKITSQTKLFLDMFGHQTIGITGTKGKGTTATLLHHILSRSGQKTWLGGNIGTPLLDGFDQIDHDTMVIAELSSYQLWDVEVSPHWAVVLMITPEHLDVHGSLADYVAAKRNIVCHQTSEDVAVIFADAPLSLEMAHYTPAQIFYVTYGDLGPGVVIRDGAVWQNTSVTNQPIISLTDTPLRGGHNLQNMAAASLVAIQLGVDPDQIKELAKGYQPLPHRLEVVATYQGITYVDDSIATTPDTAIAALNSFTEPLVMILGGVIHQADWTQFAQAASQAENLNGIVAIGNEAPQIVKALWAAGCQAVVEQAGSLEDAVTRAQFLIDDHGVVLLSPGAKSFDMFTNYQERGEKFKQIVRHLHGE